MLGKTGKNNISVCYQCRNEDISEDARYCKAICVNYSLKIQN